MLQVKIFDEEHETDLELVVNQFLEEIQSQNIIDIKYSMHAFVTNDNEQIYCYSAMIIFRMTK